jgi:hypothetical protein
MTSVAYSDCDIHDQRLWSCDDDFQQKEDVLLVLTNFIFVGCVLLRYIITLFKYAYNRD